MSTTVAFRQALQLTPAYVPGKTPASTPGMTSYKLSSNEAYLDPLPQVHAALAQNADLNPALYPDPAARELTAALAAFHGVSENSVLVTAGASESLGALMTSTLETGVDVIYPWPSFEMYPQRAKFIGANCVDIGLTAHHRLDLHAMASAINPRTRLILLCSPNNPTGAVIGPVEFSAFMDQVPSHVLVILDEAYIEFAHGIETIDTAKMLAQYANLALVRTFSKAHGLAGLRVGYVVAAPEIIGELRKATAPFGVSNAAQTAALASLALRDTVLDRAIEVSAQRDALRAGLIELGVPVPVTGGNFVWLPLGKRSADYTLACQERGLAVRNLGSGVRVTVGPEVAMARVLEVSREFLAW